MYAFCPDCETELDQSTGICPACRWDPILSVQQVQSYEPELSLTERYRGTEYDGGWTTVTVTRTPVSRGRAVVVVGLLVLASIYWVVLTFMGMV